MQLLVSRSNVKLVTFQSSGFSPIWPQMSGGFESSPKCRCRHVLRRLRSPAFDRLFSRSGRSASRDKPITRPIPQSARKKTGRVAGCLSLRLASQLQPLGPRLAPESSLAGPARVALAETREFPDSTGTASSVGRGRGPLKAAWSEAGGAARPGVSSPSIGTPSVCTVVPPRTPNRPLTHVKG